MKFADMPYQSVAIARIYWPPFSDWGMFPHPPLFVDGRNMNVRQTGE